LFAFEEIGKRNRKLELLNTSVVFFAVV